jgi:hypothetical protein
MYFTAKNEDIEFTVTFEGTEMPDARHFVFVGNVLEKLGVAVPDFEQMQESELRMFPVQASGDPERWNRASEDASNAKLNPSDWAQMVVDVAELLHPEDRDKVLQAFADEMNRRGVGTSSEVFRIEGGAWLSELKRKAELWDDFTAQPPSSGLPLDTPPGKDLQTDRGPSGTSWKVTGWDPESGSDLTAAGKAAEAYDAATRNVPEPEPEPKPTPAPRRNEPVWDPEDDEEEEL